MGEQHPNRKTYEESCELLQKLGYLEQGKIPPVPDRRPQYDDQEPLGVSFFRTAVTQGDLENLTLPRTFFGRSAVGPVSFKNTDLSESSLCWNDFNEVDFTDADLPRSDLRASIFENVVFVRANLSGADMRHSNFLACDFTDADLRGVKLTVKRASALPSRTNSVG
jgi:BTB/POZ domain-containing protein KCTD9